MTREDSPDGCIIVARLGSVLQEMQVGAWVGACTWYS
jgi:hypothetical protein